MELNFLMLIGILLIIYGVYNNPLKHFSALRWIVIGIGFLLIFRFGILSLLIVSLLFMFNRKGKFVQERLLYILPFFIIYIFKENIETYVMNILPIAKDKAIYVVIFIVTVILYLYEQNKKMLRRKLG